eukprot:gnl/MRDRNA2_/MRDRNA2_145892_c0_seq1.p1 gnl/MRDRNA2_/MRDRNA2_145892_c0~~gnl/MRDRNA2_/MRDRNA2_145892_c0_seq1.p1  ORF type:complete len:693 (+),score=128.07 gnl/MRDRNA2_/MRDRNA2_145892_c0_seq1:134-2212(+)
MDPQLQQKLQAQRVRIGDRPSPAQLKGEGVTANDPMELSALFPVPPFPGEALKADHGKQASSFSTRILREMQPWSHPALEPDAGSKHEALQNDGVVHSKWAVKGATSESGNGNAAPMKKVLRIFSPRNQTGNVDKDSQAVENCGLQSREGSASPDSSFDPSEYIALGLIGHQLTSKDVEKLIEAVQQREEENEQLKQRVAELEDIIARSPRVADKEKIDESNERMLMLKGSKDEFARDGGTGATPSETFVIKAEGRESFGSLSKTKWFGIVLCLILYLALTISTHISDVGSQPAAMQQTSSGRDNMTSATLTLVSGPSALEQMSSDLLLTSSVQLHNDITPISSMWRFELYQIPDAKFAVDRSSQQLGPEWQYIEEQNVCDGRIENHMQVLQLDGDLKYFQALLKQLKPQIVVEIGTYRGGMSYFLASTLKHLGLSHSRVLTVDIIDMDSNFHNLDNHLICPVCLECKKAYETSVWRDHVIFFQGNSIRISDQIKLQVEKSHAQFGHLGPTMILVDAQRTYDEMMTHFHLYGGSVSLNSYFVVQGVLPNAEQYQAGAYEAALHVLQMEPAQWEWEKPPQANGESRHMWLRRTSQGPPVELSYIDEMVEQEVFAILAEGLRCMDTVLAEGFLPSVLACQASCLRYKRSSGDCNFAVFLPDENGDAGQCLLHNSCGSTEAGKAGTVLSQKLSYR